MTFPEFMRRCRASIAHLDATAPADKRSTTGGGAVPLDPTRDPETGEEVERLCVRPSAVAFCTCAR